MDAGRLVIAIVDDEEQVRRALARLLVSSGYEVATFATGYEFLDYLGRERPACALLDLHLPGLSALDLQLSLKQLRPRIPSVVITGNDTPGARARVLESGAHDYLLKPLDDDVLLAALAGAIAAAA